MGWTRTAPLAFDLSDGAAGPRGRGSCGVASCLASPPRGTRVCPWGEGPDLGGALTRDDSVHAPTGAHPAAPRWLTSESLRHASREVASPTLRADAGQVRCELPDVPGPIRPVRCDRSRCDHSGATGPGATGPTGGHSLARPRRRPAGRTSAARSRAHHAIAALPARGPARAGRRCSSRRSPSTIARAVAYAYCRRGGSRSSQRSVASQRVGTGDIYWRLRALRRAQSGTLRAATKLCSCLDSFDGAGPPRCRHCIAGLKALRDRVRRWS